MMNRIFLRIRWHRILYGLIAATYLAHAMGLETHLTYGLLVAAYMLLAIV